MEQNARNSPLLSLPAELRNRIYIYIFGGRTTGLECTSDHIYADFPPDMTPHSPYDAPNNEFASGSSLLQVLAVCRQIYLEARAFPFSLSIVRFDDEDEALEPWFREKPVEMSLFSTAQLWGSGSDVTGWFEGLRYFPGLQRIDVQIEDCELVSLDEEEIERKDWKTSFAAKAREVLGREVEVSIGPDRRIF
jgi:hypothetical protein